MAESETEQAIRRHSNVYADMGLPDAAELDTKARHCAALKAKPSSRTARIAVKAA
jgi:hypothetical protein